MNRYKNTRTRYRLLFIKLLFAAYAAILVFIVFFTPNRYRSYNRVPPVYIIPLQTTINGLHRTPGEHFWPYWTEYISNLAGNIVLFIPMGFLLKALNNTRSTRYVVLLGALTSISIELLQLICKIGVCDIDDVLLNTLGTLCGVGLWKVGRKITGSRRTTS
jgi:glycopeptide antibiotics resistance protein